MEAWIARGEGRGRGERGGWRDGGGGRREGRGEGESGGGGVLIFLHALLAVGAIIFTKRGSVNTERAFWREYV